METGTEGRINIGKWTFFGTGNAENPRGNGTGILVHQSTEVESWYHIAPRITGIRIAYGDKHLSIFSVYAPVQQGRHTSLRTNQFYETLTAKTKEAKGRGDLVVIGGGLERLHPTPRRARAHWKMGKRKSEHKLVKYDQL